MLFNIENYMDFAQKGDIVIIHYTISFLNGKVFDTTKNKTL